MLVDEQNERLKVVHIKSPITQGWDRLYCGRPGKGENGTFGNPFWMKDESKRDEVCDEFEEYLRLTVKYRGELKQLGYCTETQTESIALYQGLRSLYKRVKAGERIELACFCAPKRCHCESIKEFVEEKLH